MEEPNAFLEAFRIFSSNFWLLVTVKSNLNIEQTKRSCYTGNKDVKQALQKLSVTADVGGKSCIILRVIWFLTKPETEKIEFLSKTCQTICL